MDSYSIYVHTFPNGKRYIGVTCQEPTRRWKNGEGYYQQPLVYNAIKKYGWHNIDHKILYTDLTQDEAFDLEVQLITEWKTNNKRYGYNLSQGGKGGILGTHRSEETKQKLREAAKKQTPPWLGKHLTDEHKQKIKDSKVKHVLCVETGVIYDSALEAAETVGLTRDAIGRCCRGISETSGGLHWKYVS